MDRSLIVTLLAVTLSCGCEGLKDTRAERLPAKNVEALSAQRTAPESSGFGIVKMGEQVISFTSRSWIDGEEVSVLPMISAMNRGESHVIVSVTLNGVAHVPMMVDTGAESDVLSPSLVEKLKLPLFNTGPQPLIVRGISGEQQAFAGGLGTLQLGGQVVHNDLVLVLTEQHRQYTLGLVRGNMVDSGIVGLNTLSRFRWVTFDWRHRTLTLGRKGDYAPNAKKVADIIPFTIISGKIVVSGTLVKSGRIALSNFIIDTGSDDAVLVPAPLAQEMALIDAFATRANHQWITGLGGSYIGQPFMTGAVQIGRLKFIKTSGHTVPVAGTPLFGNKLLRDYKTTFDFTHSRLVLEKR